MEQQDKPLSEEESLLQSGLEPTMVDNLKESQAQLAAKGKHLTLAQVYALEVDQPQDEDE